MLQGLGRHFSLPDAVLFVLVHGGKGSQHCLSASVLHRLESLLSLEDQCLGDLVEVIEGAGDSKLLYTSDALLHALFKPNEIVDLGDPVSQVLPLLELVCQQVSVMGSTYPGQTSFTALCPLLQAAKFHLSELRGTHCFLSPVNLHILCEVSEPSHCASLLEIVGVVRCRLLVSCLR